VTIDGCEAVARYRDVIEEHTALSQTAGVLDLSFRSRVCLTGADRVRFLHGQVTNDIRSLPVGRGCYAALVTAKGRMESDLNVYCLADELLLDFEPGLAGKISERLEKYLVADDVQVVDVASQYGLLSVQGPKAGDVLMKLGLFAQLPVDSFQFCTADDSTLGEIYLANQGRAGSEGFDLFVPEASLGAVVDKLVAAADLLGGCACGWTALEMARIEAGIPRFGLDMDETNLPQECGIESRAVSYSKGCYVGQEVLNRLHTLGHVNQELRGLGLDDHLKALPRKGDKLFHAGKEVGSIRSSVASLLCRTNIALGYIRREVNQIGTPLTLHSREGESTARVVALPFHPE
jgi:folate-binding protein YgfZ